MSSAAIEQLPYEQAAEFDEGRLHATEKEWSLRQTTWFVLCASILLWTLIFLVVRGLF